MGAGCAMTCSTVRRFDDSNGNPTFRQVMGTITRYVWHLSVRQPPGKMVMQARRKHLARRTVEVRRKIKEGDCRTTRDVMSEMGDFLQISTE
jgi:hypothetical protein